MSTRTRNPYGLWIPMLLPSRYKPKEGEQNGVHIYQLILNSMQMLPITNILQITIPPEPDATCKPNSKQKHKAATNVASKSHNKKATTKKPSTARPSICCSGCTTHVAPAKEDVAMDQV